MFTKEQEEQILDNLIFLTLVGCLTDFVGGVEDEQIMPEEVHQGIRENVKIILDKEFSDRDKNDLLETDVESIKEELRSALTKIKEQEEDCYD